MTTLRIAAFQRKPLFDDIAGTVERLTFDLAWCDNNGVQLAVFPECYLQGYASDRQTIAKRALALDSAQIEDVLSKLAGYHVDIVLGIVERKGTAFYNTAIVIRQGRIVGTYAKQNTNEHGFAPGNESPVFESHEWRFGINICYDANFPQTATKLSQRGARLICYPLNNMLMPATAAKWRQKSIENLQHRAIETGCWIMSSDVVGALEGKMSYGCTCIVQPNGLVVRQVPEGTEQAITFDLL